MKTQTIKDIAKRVGIVPKTKAKRFKEITAKMVDLFERKNADYDDTTSQLHKEYGMTYYAIMLQQKINRIKSAGANPNFESVQDSLLDIANYAILAILDEQDKV